MVAQLIFARLIKFSYLPGDLAVIHPIASSPEVEDVLDSLGWTAMADEPLSIERRLEGT